MKVLIRVLLTAIAVESVLGLLGMVADHPTRPSAHRPVALLLDTQLSWRFARAGVSASVTASGQTTRPAVVATVIHTTAYPKPTFSTSSTAPTTTLSAHRQMESLRLNSGGAAPAVQAGWGCGDALAWLSAHSAPGYQFVCPGYAEGHQAMTCDNAAPCPGSKLIVIADPCPAAYMNEAHNSWIVSGLTIGVIDPFGHCS